MGPAAPSPSPWEGPTAPGEVRNHSGETPSPALGVQGCWVGQAEPTGDTDTKALCSGMEEQHHQLHSTHKPGSAQLTLPRLVVAMRGLSRRSAWMQIL